MGSYNILRLDEVDSTNLYALRNLDTLTDGQVILAEKQTHGRGRFQRGWVSHVPNNLYMSIVLKPCRELNKSTPLASLTQYMALVICDILLFYGVEAGLKWPNDVLVRGSKIAGLLGESSTVGKCLKGFVLGAGINLNMTQGEIKSIDQPAVSLNLLTGGPVNRDDFLKALLTQFFRGYGLFMETGFSLIKEKFSKRSTFLGKKITITSLNSQISGLAGGYSDDGSLLLITEEGEEKEITTGDVLYP